MWVSVCEVLRAETEVCPAQGCHLSPVWSPRGRDPAVLCAGGIGEPHSPFLSSALAGARPPFRVWSEGHRVPVPAPFPVSPPWRCMVPPSPHAPHLHRHSLSHTYVHSHTSRHTLTHSHSQTHILTISPTWSHTPHHNTHMLIHSLRQSAIYSHTHTYSCSFTCSRIFTLTHTHTLSRTHAMFQRRPGGWAQPCSHAEFRFPASLP